MPHNDSAEASSDHLPIALSLEDLLAERAQPPTTPLSLEEVCEAILDKVQPLFPSEGCWLATAGGCDGKLEIRSWRGLPPGPMLDLQWANRLDVPAQTPIVTLTHSEAPHSFPWPSTAVRSIAVAPMQPGSREGAILLLLASQQLDPSDQFLLASVASRAGLVIRSIGYLLASQQLALQQERERIARVIHDGVSQTLALLMLKMEIISRLAVRDPRSITDELSKMMAILESSISDLRRSVYELRSPGTAGPQNRRYDGKHRDL